MNKREARCKIFFVAPELLLTVLNGVRHDCFQLPITEDIPDGAVVEAVHEDFYRRRIALRVYHESYPIVPDGQEFPIAKDIEIRMFRRIPIKDTHEIFGELTTGPQTWRDKEPLL